MISLDELTAESAAALTARERREVLRRCAALSLAVASAEEPEPPSGVSALDPDMTTEEVAALYQRSVRWVYDHRWPPGVQIARGRFSRIEMLKHRERETLRAKRRNP